MPHPLRVLLLLTLVGSVTTASADSASERERARIRDHLSAVEHSLRAQPAPAIQSQADHRAALLDTLHEYIEDGRFPQNDGRHAPVTPIFIDDDHTACAVGHLMIESGAAELAETIRANENLAYVYDIQTPGVAEWAIAHGFTVEELARIQPTYCHVDGDPCDRPDASTDVPDEGNGCSAADTRSGAMLFAFAALGMMRRRHAHAYGPPSPADIRLHLPSSSHVARSGLLAPAPAAASRHSASVLHGTEQTVPKQNES